MVIPDVNLLVYAYNGSVPQHEQAESCGESLVRSGHGVGICWPVMQGVLRILTNRRY